MAKKRIFGAVNEHCRKRLKSFVDAFDPERLDYTDYGESESIVLTLKNGKRVKLNANSNTVDGAWITVDILDPVTPKS